MSSDLLPWLVPGARDIARIASEAMPFTRRRKYARRGKRSVARAFKPKLVRRTRRVVRRRKSKGQRNIQGKNVSWKNIGKRLSKLLRPIAKGVANQKYNYNQASVFYSNAGLQNFNQIMMGSFGNSTGLGQDMPDVANAIESDYSNVWNKVTGGDVVGALYDDVRGQRFLVKNIQHTIYITNQTDAHCHMTLYDCVPRRDTDLSPYQAIIQGQRVLQDNQATDGLVSIPAASNLSRIGVEPYGVPLFMQRWKIVNQRTIIMHPGQVHRHTLNFNVNKMFNSTLLNAENTYIRGFSAATLIKQHGFPVSLVADENIATIGPSKLNVVIKKEITYAIPQFGVPKAHLTYNNLQQGVQGNFQVMNPDGDEEVYNAA